MKLSPRMIVPLLLALVGCAGCSEPKKNATLTVSGSVDSAVHGEGQRAAIIWEVGGSPDYAYKFGEGSVANGHFSITLPGDPPAEAVNFWGIGIAVVVVLAPGAAAPDGKLAPTILQTDILGMSTRGSVIWRAKSLNLPDTAVPPDWWPLGFPVGYTCGACTPAPDGGSFEGFAPASCGQLQINLPDMANVCNWT